MEDRTCKIILCAKSRCHGGSGIAKIINYLSYECGCDRDVYTESTLYRILFEALCDYIDCCDKPSIVLRNMNEAKKFDFSPNEQIVSAFTMAEVKSKDKYINGFNEKQISESEKYLSNI